jgi:hypothetical protein
VTTSVSLGLQGSIHNSKDKLDFTVDLGAIHARPALPAGTCALCDGYTAAVAPGGRWRPAPDRAGRAEDVPADFRDHGWSAILAAVGAPGFPTRSGDQQAQELPVEDSAPNYAVADSARPPSWLIPVGDQETIAPFTELADHDPNPRWAEALGDTAAIPASGTRC